MKYRLAFSCVAVVSSLLLGVRATQAAVILAPNPVTDTYTYDSTTGIADPNAVTSGANNSPGFLTYGYHPSATGVAGTVTYTFTTPSVFNTLRLEYDTAYFNAAGANTVTGTYDIGGGPVTFFSGVSPGGEGQVISQDYTISNINAQSVVVEWTLFVAANEAPRAVLFPSGGGFAPASLQDGLFNVTATFVVPAPEPSSLLLLGLGTCLLSMKRKRTSRRVAKQIV